MMLKRIFGELPEWATIQNPLLRYEVVRNRPLNGVYSRLVRIFSMSLGLGLLVLMGYAFATGGFQRGLQMPYSYDIWKMLVVPLMILQIILRVAGISMGISSISGERRRQTWDNLRATESGAEIALRTRWVSLLFHRLRWLLFPIIVGRLILLVAVLYDLTAMQGRYLDILSNRSVPSVSLEVGVILLASFMTAALLMPITATGVDVALGLLISTAFRNRAVSGIFHVLAVVFRVATSGFLLLLMVNLLLGDLAANSLLSWLLVSGYSIFADWGLLLSQLGQAGELWLDVPFSVFIGGMLLLATLAQVAITASLLKLSVYIAERYE